MLVFIVSVLLSSFPYPFEFKSEEKQWILESMKSSFCLFIVEILLFSWLLWFFSIFHEIVIGGCTCWRKWTDINSCIAWLYSSSTDSNGGIQW